MTSSHKPLIVNEDEVQQALVKSSNCKSVVISSYFFPKPVSVRREISSNFEQDVLSSLENFCKKFPHNKVVITIYKVRDYDNNQEGASIQLTVNPITSAA